MCVQSQPSSQLVPGRSRLAGQLLVAYPLLNCPLAQLYMPACDNDISIAYKYVWPKYEPNTFDDMSPIQAWSSICGYQKATAIMRNMHNLD